MKIGILSRNRTLYSTRRLLEAARLNEHQPVVIDTMRVAVNIGSRSSQLKTFSRQLLPEVHAIIPRIGTSITAYGLAVVRQFEALGVVSTASAAAIAASRDKMHSLQIMSRAGLPVPKTIVVTNLQDLWPSIQIVGGFPLIMKLVQGTQGQGVKLITSFQEAIATFQAWQGSHRPILLQSFIEEADGRDIRIIVVGSWCVAAMERIAVDGEFRANLHLGGKAAAITLDNHMEQIAIQAARALNLGVAGVDIIMGANGPLLLEVNSSPGLEGIEAATGKDVALEIIRYLEHKTTKKKRRRTYKRKQRS